MSLQIIFGLVTVILETVKSVHHNIHQNILDPN